MIRNIEYSKLNPVQKVEYVQQIIALTNVDSLDRTIMNHEGEYSELGQFIADDGQSLDEIVSNKFVTEKLIKLVNTLRPREQIIIRLRFGLDDGVPKTLEEIGRMYNITRERIRQVETMALRKLRIKLIKNGIKSINDL